jgi:Superfamily II DNA and RNA helicases
VVAAEEAPDAAVLGHLRAGDQDAGDGVHAQPARDLGLAPNTVTTLVSHQVHPVDASRKRDLLLHLLSADSRRQSLVFSRTKHGADKLVTFLNASGLRTAAIHGNKSQNARTRALSDFKSGRVTVLVATDIAARGIDIEQLPIVINFDLPMVAEDYVHRIGRTGRAGMEGLAVSLVSHDEVRLAARHPQAAQARTSRSTT